MTQDRCTASLWNTLGLTPRLVLTLFIAAGFWGKKEAENVSVFICFKSRPVLLQIHKKQHFFPLFFFFLSLAPLQHRPETRTDGDILCNPLRAYLDLSGSCILQQWRNNVFISSCSLETGRNEKKKKTLLKGLVQSTCLLSNFFKKKKRSCFFLCEVSILYLRQRQVLHLQVDLQLNLVMFTGLIAGWEVIEKKDGRMVRGYIGMSHKLQLWYLPEFCRRSLST